MSIESRYRVNVLWNGKERWKYCKTLNKAKFMQETQIQKGLSSIICKKINGKYQSIESTPPTQ
jgi:hypothetical protein